MTAVKLESMIFTRVVTDDLSERAGARMPRHAWHRPGSLPALGMPMSRRRRRLATAISLALHFLMIWLLIRPEALTDLNPDLKMTDQGNAGNGIAGGGGGGTRGTGGVKFIQIAPQPVAPPPAQSVLPPLVPVVEPPKPVLPEPAVPQLELPKLSTSDSKVEIKVESPIVGTGGGLGNDGTKGNGPGTGGGIGNGTGTGTGSGTGPGTGAGELRIIPCKSTELLIMPTPIPSKVRGFTVVANFDVDDRGKVLKFEFTPTKDGDYNRKLHDIFKGYRFRPGTTLEGVPIRTSCKVSFDL